MRQVNSDSLENFTSDYDLRGHGIPTSRSIPRYRIPGLGRRGQAVMDAAGLKRPCCRLVLRRRVIPIIHHHGGKLAGINLSMQHQGDPAFVATI